MKAVRAAATVHPTAVVDAGAKIGAGTKIWHFSHVMAGAKIGAGCVLGQNVFVGAEAIVGDRCKLQNNVSIFDAVELGSDVFIGPSAVFTNVKTPRAFISRKRELTATKVGRGATIGANATIICGHSLGEFSFVAAGAVVTTDVAPYALFAGVPASHRGWVCRCGTTLQPLRPRETTPENRARAIGSRAAGATAALAGKTAAARAAKARVATAATAADQLRCSACGRAFKLHQLAGRMLHC